MFCFTFVESESNDEVLVIRDSNNPACKTITNAAEEVVKYLHDKGWLGSKRLLYYDTDGRKDELLHDSNGKFIDFNILSQE
jgi:hypothetical protein